MDVPLLEVLKAWLDEAQPDLVEGVPASGLGLALDDFKGPFQPKVFSDCMICGQSHK